MKKTVLKSRLPLQRKYRKNILHGREDGSADSRTILLLMVVQAVGGYFVLEQPVSSLLPRHDRFRWLVREWCKLKMEVPRFKPNKVLSCSSTNSWAIKYHINEFQFWINSLGT